MHSKITWPCAALVSALALVGCDRNATEGRPGDSALSRNDEGQPPSAVSRDSASNSIRPPTTTTQSPAAPGASPPAATPPAATPRLLARADVQPLGDTMVRGIVEFQTAATDGGPLTVHVMLMGLDAGPHGMHVHMGTDCSAPGTHLNPQNSPHGPANAGAAARHLGDLGNITADAAGMVDEMLRDAQLASDVTFLGKVVIVHKGQDDLTTQPDGGAGEPIACGIVEPAESVISQSEGLNRGV